MTTAIQKNHSRKMLPSTTLWNTPLDRFFKTDFPDIFDSENSLTVPAINVTEEKNNYIVNMAAPGLKKEDFDISLDGNLLTISSEKESEKDDDSERFSRREYNYSYFSRSVTLPDSAETKNIAAKYTDGILSLTIPKKPDTDKNRSLKIKVQ